MSESNELITMVSNYHAIYLSPHLDDAALSCGGQIYQRTQAGQSVLIVTVMAGDPMGTAVSDYIQSLHERWELLSDSVAARRVEDKAACQILGADYTHWQVPDAIYRINEQSGAAFYDSDNAIFADVHPVDCTQLLDSLMQQMHALPPHGDLYVPLGVGHHVDHQLVRLAAEHCFGKALLYYEEYPYVQNTRALETFVDRKGWYSERVRLDETAVLARINAVAAYKSQLSTFFNGRHDLEKQIRTYIADVDGERTWRHQPE